MDDKFILGEGPVPCDLMLCGEGPGLQELKRGRPFVGPTGQEVNNLLKYIVGIERANVYVTNVMKYGWPENKEVTDEDLKLLTPVLMDEIKEVKPKVILALGALATRWFLGDGIDMEAVNAMPHRWKLNERIIIVPSFHPAIEFHESTRMSWIIGAFETAKVMLEKGDFNGKIAGTTICTPFDTYVLGPKKGYVAVDTESLDGDNPYLITVTSGEGWAQYIKYEDKKKVQEFACYLLSHDTMVVLHNALYDLPILWSMGVHPARWIDTMVMAFLLQTLPLSLKALAYKLCRMKVQNYEEVTGGKGDLSSIPFQKAVKYACSHADATIRIYNKLRKMVDSAGINWEVLERDMDIMPALCSMMGAGMKFDAEYMKELEIEFSLRNIILRDGINTMARKHGWKPGPKSKDSMFNPASAPQVSELLYKKLKLGAGQRINKTKWGGSTDHKTLEKIKYEHKVVPMILEWRGTDTLEDKYISVLPNKVGEDRRIHTKLSLVRVPHSGRIASSDPNLMAQPTRTEDGLRIRNGFVAEDGWELVSFDYCLAPDTRVLTMDLRWKPISDLKEGEILWGVEENCEKSFTPRHMIPSIVEKTRKLVLPSYAIATDDGKCIIASGEHPWLAKDNRGSKDNVYKWIKTSKLVPNRFEIWNASDVWDESNQWEDGYLAGAFDGEGSISVGRGIILTFTQKPGIMLNFVGGLLKDKGYEFHDPWMGKGGGFKNSHPVASIWISNRRDIARFLGTYRPQRLLDKAIMLFMGRRPPVGKSRVVSVTPIGKCELVSIQTSSKTFIAEGLITHNSQIEMRLMAHFSQDKVMLDVYKRGGDVHTDTAMRAFGIKRKEDVDEMKHRYPSKRTGFGVINSITAIGLSRELMAGGAEGWTEDRCQEFLDSWFKIHTGVATYIGDLRRQVRENGYITDMWGRVELIPEVRSCFPHIREQGLRRAGNQPIQSGAQGIIKEAMRRLWGKIGEDRDIRWLIQIHDSLLFEIKVKKIKEVTLGIKKIMEEVTKLSIPFPVKVETGKRWGSMCR